MAIHEIEGTEPIPVHQLCCLFYGQPGARKSSLCQTAHNPVTLASDPGIYRAHGRKKAVTFDEWADVVNYNTTGADTVAIDTVGMLLDKLSAAIIAENPKNGNRLGGLSLPGYGVLKARFAAWVGDLRQKGKDILFTAHEKAERNGDEVYYCPDIVGGSYNTLMNHSDIVGYLHFESGKRVLDFAPTDRFMAKIPPAFGPYAKKFLKGAGTIVLPDFDKEPEFLGKLLAEIKAGMGQISAASALVAEKIGQWQTWLAQAPPLDAFNARLPEVAELQNGAKAQVWHLVTEYAQAQGWERAPKATTFTKGGAK